MSPVRMNESLLSLKKSFASPAWKSSDRTFEGAVKRLAELLCNKNIDAAMTLVSGNHEVHRSCRVNGIMSATRSDRSRALLRSWSLPRALSSAGTPYYRRTLPSTGGDTWKHYSSSCFSSFCWAVAAGTGAGAGTGAAVCSLDRSLLYRRRYGC